MPYLFVALVLLAGSIKGYCGKKTSGCVQERADALFINVIRMLLCIVIGMAIVWSAGDISKLPLSSGTLAIYSLSGISTSVFVVSWLLAVRTSAYMLVDVFLMLGVLIPSVLTAVFFDETIKWNQWLGIAILIVAVLIMCSYNSSIKKKMTLSSILMLVICGSANGFADFSQKLFKLKYANLPSSVFNFYTYVFSAVTLIIFYLLLKHHDSRGEKFELTKMPKSTYIYIVVMAICLFANSYFKTEAAEYIDSATLYPLVQGSSLILATFMSAFIFKEKLTVKAVVGVVLAFIALVIINVL